MEDPSRMLPGAPDAPAGRAERPAWLAEPLQLSWRFAYVWLRNLRVWRRYWFSNLLSSFLEPMLYLIGMGFGLGRHVSGIEGVPYQNFIAPGLVASSAMFAATFECTFGTYVRMVYQKTFDAIIATPVSLDEVIAGELLTGATKSAMYGSVILLVITGAGLVPAPGPRLLLVPPAAFLTGLVFASLAMAVAAAVPQIEMLDYYFTLFITPTFMFSGIFFPLDDLPGWAQRVAGLTPLMHAVRLIRGLVMGRTGHLTGDALWLLVAALVLLPVPVLLMRRRLVR
ncbi:ABC transporter permease [Caldinitratiruptor microaerophilus]|uniref:Transport permease protein n=1 Tax=Caldinitratiruptor microaerophilus TaxID=671077 RepID=A0AA35CIS7_9FIRM|nr:ABC transporter permease [Caldinitratiruptor microaerophilus]BDG59093.1 transport permease protein [Caldinitratiruptor microaerophilus]